MFWAYTRLTGQDLFAEPALAAWLRYHAYFFLPDNRNVNFGTSNYGGRSAPLHNRVLVDGRGPGGDTLGTLEDAVMRPHADAATITTA